MDSAQGQAFYSIYMWLTLFDFKTRYGFGWDVSDIYCGWYKFWYSLIDIPHSIFFNLEWKVWFS